jgi:LPS export ABC transporter protein LptC
MLSPLLVGILFFVFSAISAFIALESTEMPENFDEVTLNITDYQIQQIDEVNNSVKWVLKAETAQTDGDESKAFVTKPQVKFFDAGKEKFTIDGKTANLDKAKQEIVITDNVVLKTTDGSITILTNKMFFSEENPYVEFSDNWQLKNNKGYIIAGVRGKLNKKQDYIISEGNASLTKKSDNLNITADVITLDLKGDVPVKAKSNATLKIGVDKKLVSDLINISANGGVRADGAVKVFTPSIECYSTQMQIVPKANKKPKTAIFTGSPYVIQQGNKLFADKIIYDFDSGEAHLEGSVHSG